MWSRSSSCGDKCDKWGECDERCWQVPWKHSFVLEACDELILLMEEILHHLLFIKPYEKWDVLHTGAGFLPSKIRFHFCPQGKAASFKDACWHDRVLFQRCRQLEQRTFPLSSIRWPKLQDAQVCLITSAWWNGLLILEELETLQIGVWLERFFVESSIPAMRTKTVMSMASWIWWLQGTSEV